MSRRFPIKLERDDNGTLLVMCPALPEVTTFGESEADAIVHAVDAIEEAIAVRKADGEDIPAFTALGQTVEITVDDEA